MNVDLRSDTVTRPTPEMYSAMASAPLGDDVLGDDPTVIKLEQETAKLLGKQAALYVPSGTMSNQIAIATHTHRGDAIIAEEEAHIFYYEVGAPAVLSGVVSWTLPSDKGAMDPEAIRKRILKPNLHTPGTSLVCIENTHNRAGGTIVPQELISQYRKIVDEAGIKLHMDGARVWNAAVGLGISPAEVVKNVDTVSVCLSKGLRSPVGSVLVGPSDFIEKARIWRKRLGGGMRQAGILAACGLVSLTQIDRLQEDHHRAKQVAAALHAIRPDLIDLERVQTNIVLVGTTRHAEQWQAEFAELGIHFFPVAHDRFRLVFHADIDDEMTAYAMSKLSEAMRRE